MTSKQRFSAQLSIVLVFLLGEICFSSSEVLLFEPHAPDSGHARPAGNSEKSASRAHSPRSNGAWSTLQNGTRSSYNSLMNRISSSEYSKLFGCPCTWPPYCMPIKTKPKKEVMIFSVKNNKTHWENYDWKRITTVVMFGYYNSDLMCLAHKHGARVVSKIGFPLSNVTNTTQTDSFIKNTVAMVKSKYLDGVNIDIEDAVGKSDFKRMNAFTLFVKKLTTSLKTVNDNFQISFDSAWSPSGIDGRNYDLLEISKSVDYLFVMAYDEQSQMFEKDCIARANSGFNKTVTGVLRYIQKNINRNKLILGVPWYGYDYPCLSLSEKDVCTIKKVPFRGVNCTDAAGKQRKYSDLEKLLKDEHLILRWHNATSTPFFNYKDSNGTFHQVWFDDVQSLSLKYAFAVKVGLGGVGMWTADFLNYSATAEAVFKAMWQALPVFPTRG